MPPQLDYVLNSVENPHDLQLGLGEQVTHQRIHKFHLQMLAQSVEYRHARGYLNL
jgi:hypothetical protein